MFPPQVKYCIWQKCIYVWVYTFLWPSCSCTVGHQGALHHVELQSSGALTLLHELSVIAANNVIPRVCISRLTVFDWCQLTLLLSGINSRLTATMWPVFQLPLYRNGQLWSLLPKNDFVLPLLLSMPDNNGSCHPFWQVTLKSTKCKFLKWVAFPHAKDNYLFMEEWRKKGKYELKLEMVGEDREKKNL